LIGVAIAVTTVLAALAGAIVATRIHSNAGQGTRLGLTVATFAMAIFLRDGSGQLFEARVIPVSAAMIYSDLAAIFAALATLLSINSMPDPCYQSSCVHRRPAGLSGTKESRCKRLGRRAAPQLQQHFSAVKPSR
jgi:hypothetical protein